MDQVDWGSNLRRFDYHIDRTGLYALEWKGGRLERVPTAALDAWCRYVSLPITESVGELEAPAWKDAEPHLW